ncbi:aromatic compound dioxygenase [Macroventuria anomochaeta]|uniref:Aromatic compound dioxygenase n=1 Tax=Macroventuria anomochaeta TaxID=301207 RepID=A0ACB6RTW0_9PLEO|nr:aromatic compound dioxygenase [Macroventuria anomochaeta]KAF2625351.1 aromatic compound dioxygenase [Macroventuria anomochaeta]
MKFISALAGAALLAQQSTAHPGDSPEEHAREIAQRAAYLSTHKRSLAHCADTLKARGNDLAMAHRRSLEVKKLRAKRAIDQEKNYLRARDLDTVLATSHASNLTGITADTDPSVLFTGNNSCILTPEVTQGPYWVQGELIREDITEDQEGVPLHLDIQVIDVNTCEPVPSVYLELWHCNSTGVYSGVIASGNGDSSDESNLDNTFLRGINQADENGVVQFDTLFPGHYTSRATHIHVMTHTLDATVNDNNTLTGASVTHVGQMFFDQDLIETVDTVEPYASNTQVITENANDSILSEEAGDVDPMVEYVLLGDDVSEGIFGWLAFGMDSSASYNVTPAANLYAEGGVANENSQMGGGGGSPPGGNGTDGAPTGAIPSGAIPSSANDLAVGSTLTTLVSSSAVASSSAVISSSVSSAAASVAPAATPSKAPQAGKDQGQNNGKGQQQQAQQQQQQAQKQDNGPHHN